ERVFWGADEELSDGGSPRVIVYGYDGLPMQPVAPPSPDYVPGPEHPPSPDYVPGPKAPTFTCRGYVADSDPDEDPEEDPEEDHADYPADGGDGDDEPSDDDDDTDDEDEEPFEDEDDDEEEEHLAFRPTLLLYPLARKTVRLEPQMLVSMEARITEHVAVPTLPLHVASQPSPAITSSSPLPSPLTTCPTAAGAPLGY
ncbi:hypothetical protein Tco_0635155, partial [Tanacetum coccineum]